MKIVLSNPFLNRDYPITQYFDDEDTKESYAKFGLKSHNGIDYGCPNNTPLYSSYDGVVTRVGFDPDGYGTFVRITTDFGRLIYAHMDHYVVTLNQRVQRGAMLGRSDNTGNSTGPHLHFEMRLDGQENNGWNGAVDPLPYFNGIVVPIPEEQPLNETGTAQVTADVLNLRYNYGIGSNIVGTLNNGCIFDYKSYIDVEGGIWLEIFEHIWCAYYYSNTYYCSIINK